MKERGAKKRATELRKRERHRGDSEWGNKRMVEILGLIWRVDPVSPDFAYSKNIVIS